jgi:hypothetical protein
MEAHHKLNKQNPHTISEEDVMHSLKNALVHGQNLRGLDAIQQQMSKEQDILGIIKGGQQRLSMNNSQLQTSAQNDSAL